MENLTDNINSLSTQWNPEWDKLPVGEVSQEILSATNIEDVRNLTSPYGQVWLGKASNDFLINLPSYFDEGSLVRGIVLLNQQIENLPKPLTRSDAYQIFAFITGAFTMIENYRYNSAIRRPIDSPALYLSATATPNWILIVYADKLSSEEKLLLIENYFKLKTTELPKIIQLYFNDSIGITVLEKNNLEITIENELAESNKNIMRTHWVQNDGDIEKFEEMWNSYSYAMHEVKEAAEYSKIWDGLWKRQVYIDKFQSLGLPHTPEEILDWAKGELSEVTKKMNQLAIANGYADWVTLWGQTEISIPKDKEQILEYYRNIVEKINNDLRKNNIYPPLPDNCTIEVIETPAHLRQTFPLGGAGPAPLIGNNRTSFFYVTIDEDLGNITEHDIEGSVLASHETAHSQQSFFQIVMGVIKSQQSFYNSDINETILSTGFLKRIAEEAHAIMIEKVSYDLNIIENNFKNYLGILKFLLWRISMVVFELESNMGLKPRDVCLEEYREVNNFTQQFAEGDVGRAQNPTDFLIYHIGESQAMKVKDLYGEDFLREWLEESGAVIPANYFAWLKGKIGSPQDVGVID